jgi:GTPase SAR1 family protein
MTNILDTSLQERQSRINNAKSYLEATQVLFDEFGSAELKTSHARFPELLNALNSNEVRLVVIGEFSRGKSSLVNALLGINLLRSAQQATTAINTFIRSLPDNRKDRFIRVHYQGNKASEEIAWTNEEVLEQWGTELDSTHADVRQQIDHIEVFTDHPLLKRGLTLIDTPGLQSVVKHHEAITRRAIAESHIALWVQSAAQLGGTATEWEFLSDTIRQNFSKFITVVNMWDKVLDPIDDHEKRKSPERLALEKMEVVKKNFKMHLKELPTAELASLTDSDHLMGVSAFWALQGDEAKRNQSGLDHLSRRLAEMFSSGEAMEQIYHKPLKQLSGIQQQLIERVSDDLVQLNSSASLAERERELEKLGLEIQSFEKEKAFETKGSADDHQRVAETLTNKIKEELVEPLVKLRDTIEDKVDEKYIQKLVHSKSRKISLPPDVEDDLKTISSELSKSWDMQKSVIQKTLVGLRADYLNRMEKHAGKIEAGLGGINISMPDIDIRIEIDFDALEAHQQRASKVQEQIQQAEEGMNDLDNQIAGTQINDQRRLQAQSEKDRLQRQLENMGPPPSPVTRSKRIKTSDYGSGFLWLSPSYDTIQVTDRSNVDSYYEEKSEFKEKLANKEAALQKIIADDFQKTGHRMTLELAHKKLEKDRLKLQKKIEDAEQRIQQERDELIQLAMKKLSVNTIKKIEESIRFLEKSLSAAIRNVFMQQSKILEQCVIEHLVEPLNAKLAQREQVQVLLQKSQIEVAQRKARLLSAQKQLGDLNALTRNALQS